MLNTKSIVTTAIASVLVAGMSISSSVLAGDMKHQHGQMESHSYHNMQANAGKQMMAEVVTAEGVVSRIDQNSQKLIVHHQPIAEWKMSEMQMKFGLAPELSISDFQEGQQIRFRLKQENMMKFTITEVLK